MSICLYIIYGCSQATIAELNSCQSPPGSICPQSLKHPLSALLQKKPAYHSSWRRKWQPTPLFLPGESHRQRSLAGYITVYGVTRVRHDRATKHSHLSPDVPCLSLEKYRNLVLFGLTAELTSTPVWSCLSSHMCPGLAATAWTCSLHCLSPPYLSKGCFLSPLKALPCQLPGQGGPLFPWLSVSLRVIVTTYNHQALAVS